VNTLRPNPGSSCALQLQGNRLRLVNTPWTRTPLVQRHDWGAGPGGELSVDQLSKECSFEERQSGFASFVDRSPGILPATASEQ
jgi:hypothetical protein